MNLSPVMVEKLDGTVQSPFADLTLKSKGNKKEGEVTVSGDIFPLAIQENFLAGMRFNNLPKTMQLNAEIKNTAKTVVINKLTFKPEQRTYFNQRFIRFNKTIPQCRFIRRKSCRSGLFA